MEFNSFHQRIEKWHQTPNGHGSEDLHGNPGGEAKDLLPAALDPYIAHLD
jgi:hypothetical protein